MQMYQIDLQMSQMVKKIDSLVTFNIVHEKL